MAVGPAARPTSTGGDLAHACPHLERTLATVRKRQHQFSPPPRPSHADVAEAAPVTAFLTLTAADGGVAATLPRFHIRWHYYKN